MWFIPNVDILWDKACLLPDLSSKFETKLRKEGKGGFFVFGTSATSNDVGGSRSFGWLDTWRCRVFGIGSHLC